MRDGGLFWDENGVELGVAWVAVVSLTWIASASNAVQKDDLLTYLSASGVCGSEP